MATPKEAEKNKTVPAKTASSESNLSMTKKTFVDVVAEKALGFIQRGELQLPKDYSVNNALKSAWLKLQSIEDKDHKLALTVCTHDSIANSLLDMVVQGLNPAKNQCYFIVYGNKLTCQRSYFGSMAVTAMVEPRIGEFALGVVYEGDIFKYTIKNGKKEVTAHEQNLESLDNKKIIGAYAIALDKEDKPFRTEIMTIAEIHQAWRQSKMNPFEGDKLKESSTHGRFAGDMAKKTVANRLCKLIINASSDNALLLDTINRMQEMIDEITVKEEIEEQENTGPVIEIEQAKAEGTKDALLSEQENADLDKQIAEAEAKRPKKGPGF